MKALETNHKGFRFRSRLEARWAVFMDAMNVPYEYEKEAFDLDGLHYLPDFWLPKRKAWLEIKPEHPTREEEEKAMRLCQFTGATVFILFSKLQDPWQRDELDTGESAHMWSDGGYDFSYFWCECPHCGRCDLQYLGRAERIDCSCPKPGRALYRTGTERILAAYEKARGYRFEPGAHNFD